MKNKVVARYVDGRLIKGSTSDFVPAKDVFHVSATGAPTSAPPVRVQVSDLKAVFFVKDFAGNAAYTPRNEFSNGRSAAGRKIKVVFKDGETILGTTQGYQPGRPGFFIVPADPDVNIERCYVVAAATTDVALL